MSNKLVSEVSDLALPRAPKEVLRALCDSADDFPGKPGLGVSCYPSNERIAWKSDYVERQVQRALRQLELSKVIVPIAVHPVYGTTEYEIHLERAPRKPPFQPKEKRGPGRDRRQLRKGDILSPRVTPVSPQGVTFSTPLGDFLSPEGVTSRSPKDDILSPQGVTSTTGKGDILSPYPVFPSSIESSSPEGNIYTPPEPPARFGEFQNVRLTEDQFAKLKVRFNGTAEDRIEELSGYLQQIGPKKAAVYHDHYATILNWARKDERERRNSVGESKAQQRSREQSEAVQRVLNELDTNPS